MIGLLCVYTDLWQRYFFYNLHLPLCEFFFDQYPLCELLLEIAIYIGQIAPTYIQRQIKFKSGVGQDVLF